MKGHCGKLRRDLRNTGRYFTASHADRTSEVMSELTVQSDAACQHSEARLLDLRSSNNMSLAFVLQYNNHQDHSTQMFHTAFVVLLQ